MTTNTQYVSYLVVSPDQDPSNLQFVGIYTRLDDAILGEYTNIDDHLYPINAVQKQNTWIFKYGEYNQVIVETEFVC